MIHFVLLFFGATFMYAGVLMMPQDVLVGTCSTLLGTALSIDPFVRLVQLARRSVVAARLGRKYEGHERGMRKGPSWLENDEKPTYH